MYDAALARDPTVPNLYRGRGQCYLHLNDPSRAASEVEKALQLSAPSVDLLTLAAQAHWAAGHGALAEERLASALEADPKDPSVHFLLGELHEARGRREAAAAAFAAVSALDPHFGRPYVAQAEAAVANGETAAALRLWQAALRVASPTAASSLHQRCADTYSRLGPSFASSAVLSLTRAIETDTEGTGCLPAALYLRRARILRDPFGDLDAAIDDLSVAVALTTEPADESAAEESVLIEALAQRAEAYRQRNGPGDLLRARGDYGALAPLGGLQPELRGTTNWFLGEAAFEDGDLTAAAHHYAVAWAWGLREDLDPSRVLLAISAAHTAGGSALETPAAPTPSLRHLLLADHAAVLRALEPTAHPRLAAGFLDRWLPYARTYAETRAPPKGRKAPAAAKRR